MVTDIKHLLTLRGGALLLGAAILIGAPAARQASAQITTGAMGGVVTDESGGVLPGATVTATHVGRGVSASAVSDGVGRFLILNLPAGGPYEVVAALSGFSGGRRSGIQVPLGGTQTVSFRLAVGGLTENVSVVAGQGVIGADATGPASNVSLVQIESLPTIARGLEDFARLSPYFLSSGAGDGSGANTLSVAGRSSRYNNVQIDGAVNNDLFGIADSGTPGGQTETQPISLDAVQELQLVVSPYDVRQGGFSGGGLNAVTRSGTNDFRGAAYFYFRNRNLAGPGPCPANPNVACPPDDARKLSKFSDRTVGVSVGGPIRKDRIFFFVNADLVRREQPTGFSLSGVSGTDWRALNAVRTGEAERVLTAIRGRYDYDPGSADEFTREIRSNKVIAKIDANLTPAHRLSIRHNFIDADNDVGTQSNTQYRLPDSIYEIRDRTNSTVAQLNSTMWGGANELRIAFTTVRDQRDGPTNFPATRVDLSDGSSLFFGRETFSTANELDQDIVELTNDFTVQKGRHTWTIGTHNEFFKFRNLFIRDNFGSYRFSSVTNFEAGLA